MLFREAKLVNIAPYVTTAHYISAKWHLGLDHQRVNELWEVLYILRAVVHINAVLN